MQPEGATQATVTSQLKSRASLGCDWDSHFSLTSFHLAMLSSARSALTLALLSFFRDPRLLIFRSSFSALLIEAHLPFADLGITQLPGTGFLPVIRRRAVCATTTSPIAPDYPKTVSYTKLLPHRSLNQGTLTEQYMLVATQCPKTTLTRHLVNRCLTIRPIQLFRCNIASNVCAKWNNSSQARIDNAGLRTRRCECIKWRYSSDRTQFSVSLISCDVACGALHEHSSDQLCTDTVLT